MRSVILIVIFTLSAIAIIAQRDTLDTSKSDAAQDSLSTQQKRNSLGTIFKGKPGRAALYSLLIPGAGQAYNRRWLKIPLAIGLDATAGFFVYYYSDLTRSFNACYDSFLLPADPDTGEPAPLSDECGRITNIETAFNTRNRIRARRDYAWMFLVGAHLLQTIEAYIDRNLIDFDVDENLSFLEMGQPVPGQLLPTVQFVTLRIPISR